MFIGHLLNIHFAICYINNRFPGNDKELMPPPKKKVYREMKPYHMAYDNAKNK